MHRFKNIYLLVLIIGTSLSVKAQFDQDYTPISQQDVNFKPFLISRANLDNSIHGEDLLPEKEREKFFKNIHYFRQKLNENGNIYPDNEISSYLNEITNRLLKNYPQYFGRINVYLSKSIEANAFCLAEGSIFINIGLIQKLDNIDQLAFILAHEMAHYIKSHAINDTKRLSDVVKSETFENNSDKNSFRKLKFSRESEFDADGFALQMIIQAGFNPERGILSLNKLGQKDTIGFSEINLQLLDKYFNNQYFKYDTAWVSSKAIENLRKRKSYGSGFLTDDFGDLLKTHPDLEKRLIALQEMIQYSSEPQVTDMKNDHKYQYYKEMAHFELIENALKESYYQQVIYHCISLLEKYPENIYLNTSLLKAFYWISYYKEINKGTFPVKEPTIINDNSYFAIISIFNKAEIGAIKKLAFGIAKITGEQIKSNESILFYQALCAEHYLGKNAAIMHYSKYLTEYPNGKNAAFVKSRLN
jgi:beta-barrel assembly-enhancing protease